MLNTLIFPILMFLLGGFLILHDAIPDGKVDIQGESGLGSLIVIAATGRGLDVLERVRGRGGA